MLHSRLLKFILPANGINKMAEPTEPKFEYQNPNNVESQVPGAQNIREASAQDSTNAVTNDSNRQMSERNGALNMEDKREPKKAKTKIPVSRFKQTVEKVKAERRASKERESHVPVRRSSIPKPVRDKSQATAKKELTITKPEAAKQNAQMEDEFDKIYAEMVVDTPTEVNIDDSILSPKVDDPQQLESTFEDIIHDYEEQKVEPVEVEVVRRSKIPFLKRKSQQDIELSAQADRTNKILAARDKLRQRHSLNNNEDFEKELDRELNKPNFKGMSIPKKYNKFEDISKEGPATDSKTEKSFKHEIISSPNSKVEIKRELTKTVSISNDVENNQTSSIVETVKIEEVTTNETINKNEKKHGLVEENIMKGSIKICIPVCDSYTHNYSDTSETSKTVEVKRVLSYTPKNADLSPNNTMENGEQKYPKTFETHFDRQLDVSFTENTNNDMLKVNKLSTEIVPNENDNLYEGHKEEPSKMETLITEDHEQSLTDKSNEDPLQEEDVVQLRGKVGRIISKIDSKEMIETDVNKRESINELTMKKSVLSKIAMFEKTEPEVTLKPKTQKETNLPKLITKDLYKVEHMHVHTPLIVDEVFKTYQSNIDFSYKDNKAEDSANGDVTTFVREERVTVTTPDSVHYALENKIHTEGENEVKNVYSSQNSELQTFASSENTIPASIEKDLKIDTLEKNKKTDHIYKISSVKDINIIKDEPSRKETEPSTPGFKTVSELLRSFESKTPKRSVPRRHISREFSYKPIDFTETETKLDELTQNTQHFTENKEFTNNFEPINEYKSLDDVFTSDTDMTKLKLRQNDDLKRAKSLAELDLGDALKGKVSNLITRMVSVDRMESRKEVLINIKEMPRKRSVSEKIALFEGKLTPSRSESPAPLRIFKSERNVKQNTSAEVLKKDFAKIEISKDIGHEKQKKATESIKENLALEIQKNATDNVNGTSGDVRLRKTIEDLKNAKIKYGTVKNMPGIELSNGMIMPVLAVGTALIDPNLIYHVITAAIDLGYRAIDTAFIYGNEKQVGEAIRAKIEDGTVKREELFVISKLWSTYHRSDLVEGACRASLNALALEYVDLYLVHNPMSLKEGAGPLPKIATVLQYSEHDYLDAWYGMETLVAKGLARSIGVSNFNSVQVQRVLDKGRVKPVIDQVECHPYLSQQRLDQFCSSRGVAMSCFGVLGSRGTPAEYTSGAAAVIDDAFVQVMASGLNVTPAQLLIRYQLENDRNVVVKTSTAAHLWDNLQALNFRLSSVEVDALNALNRNRRTFTFKGMGDTHKNYPFNIAF